MRAVCAVPKPGESTPSEEVGNSLEMLSVLQLTNAIRARLRQR
jgi:hypothetical protein